MRRLSAVLVLPLILTACTTTKAPRAEQPVSVPTVPVTEPQPATPASTREQAMAQLRAGNPLDAAQFFAELAAMEPTADNWSDLSYAYLLGKDWQHALDAANKALDLNQEHAGAAYNAGMAAIELGDTSLARHYLMRSAKLQPDRYEPHLALVRVYLGQDNAPLAAYHLNLADRLSGGQVDTALIRRTAAILADAGPKPVPDEVKQSCTGKQKLEDGALTLCLYLSGRTESFYDVYAITNGKAVRISLGHFVPTPQPWHKAALPGGATGYWLAGMDFVVDHSQFHLFVIKDGAVTPVIFTGQPDANAGYFTDYVRSYQPPGLKGDLLEAYSRGADGKRILQTLLRPAPDLATVEFVSSQLMSNK